MHALLASFSAFSSAVHVVSEVFCVAKNRKNKQNKRAVARWQNKKSRCSRSGSELGQKMLIVWSLKVKIEKIYQCRGNQLSHSGFCRCKILIREEEEGQGETLGE